MIVDCDIETRMLFREYKKQLAEENFWKGENKVLDFNLTEFNKFLEERDKEDRLKLINVIDLSVPEEEKNYNNLGTNAEKYVKYYFDLFIKRFRPIMLKETPLEYDYDFDFDIDEKNYDPWTEYKMIYRDALTRGRSYWIIKSMPEWFFLQVGKPKVTKMNNISRYNPKRPDMEDSVFHFITNERYFDERDKKMNIYNGLSQSIRI